MRKRIAAIAGVATFAVLAGTGVGYAYWSSSATATGTVKSASLANTCASPVKIVNGGLESPSISPSTIKNIGVTELNGWTVVNDSTVEVWRGYNDGAMPVHPLPAAEGAQFVELNGNGPGTLYQDVTTTPGQILHWSIKHHGRWGTDTMRVSINASGGALVQQAQFSTSNADWSMHEGDYVVPAGQTSTRISLTAVSTATGDDTVGNLIDDVTFGSGPCLTSTAAISNVTTGGTTYKVGDVVEYTTTVANSGGNHANSSVFTASVPTGLAFVPGSITVDGVAKTDATGDDSANYTGGTVTARLGQGASGTVGGAIPPANSVVVKFRATVQAAAAGTSLSYTSSTAYVDALAALWPLAAVSPTLTTPVDAAADVAVTVQSTPDLSSAAGLSRSWVFRVTNNGPGTATAVSVVVNVPSTVTGGRTIAITGGAGGTCGSFSGNSVTCTITTMASGASRDITFTGNMPNPMSGTYATSATASTVSYDNVPGNNSATGTAQDVTAPTTPTNLAATRTSATQINLTWTASTDNFAVAGYRIYRNGALVATTSGTGTTYNNTGLTSHQPYWYWIEAIDAAGNVSGQSAGAGAVTYATGTSYRVQNVNPGIASGTRLCVVADANSNLVALHTADCDSASTALRQWSFVTISGNDVYVRFASGTDRRWNVANDTSGTDLRTSTTSNTTGTDGSRTNVRSRWNLGVYWTGTEAVVEIRRTSATTLCLDVEGASTTTGAVVQQYTCNQTVAQRFALVQP